MSDRTVQESDLTIDGEVATLRALLDELELERVTLIGGSCGSCTAIAFAAAFPERVERLVLYGSYPDGAAITAPGVGDAIIAAVRAHWGLGSRLLSDIFLGGADACGARTLCAVAAGGGDRRNRCRVVGSRLSPRRTRRTFPSSASRRLVVHRRDDRAVPFRLGREVAAAIPGATFIPLQGSAHFPWHGDVDSVVRACREALAPAQSSPRASRASRSRSCCPVVSVRSLPASRAVSAIARSPTQLVLSSHTVHRHVANIRRKLGRTSRTAAVAEAARLGLL